MDRVEDDYGSTTQLLGLNDDCLVEMFQYLSVEQRLRMVGCLCRRIDGIICRSFSLLKYLKFYTESAPKFNAEQLDIVGRSLRSLYINGKCEKSAALALTYLQPICSHKSLQFLTLRYMRFNESIQECVMNVAEQLITLDLSYVNLTDAFLGPILEKAINLNKLLLFGNPDLRFVSLNCIKSEHIKMIVVEENRVYKDKIEKFREKNPHMRLVIFSHGYLEEPEELF